MSRFVFLINTSNIPKKQKIVVNLTAGFIFILGFLIYAFSIVSLFPEICDEIGFNSKGKSTFIVIFIVGSIFCGIAYFLAFILNYNWKKEANKQLKYDEVFWANNSFIISSSFSAEWENSIRNVFKETGIINLICLNGSYAKEICFVDCRYIGVLNQGGDYSLVIINNDDLVFKERKYFSKQKKALEYLKKEKTNLLALNFMKDLDLGLSIIMDKNTITLIKLHKFTKPELFSVYSSVDKFFM